MPETVVIPTRITVTGDPPAHRTKNAQLMDAIRHLYIALGYVEPFTGRVEDRRKYLEHLEEATFLAAELFDAATDEAYIIRSIEPNPIYL